MVYGIALYADVSLFRLGCRHSTLSPVCRLAAFTQALLSAFRFASAFWRWLFSWTSLCQNRSALIAALGSRVLFICCSIKASLVGTPWYSAVWLCKNGENVEGLSPVVIIDV